LAKSHIDEAASLERADNEAVLEPVSLRVHQMVRIQVDAHLVVELEVGLNVFEYGCRKLHMHRMTASILQAATLKALPFALPISAKPGFRSSSTRCARRPW